MTRIHSVTWMSKRVVALALVSSATLTVAAADNPTHLAQPATAGVGQSDVVLRWVVRNDPCDASKHLGCFGVFHRMAEMSANRWLVGTAEDELTSLTTLKLSLVSGATAVEHVRNVVPFETLPARARDAMVAATHAFRRHEGSTTSEGVAPHGSPPPVVDGVTYDRERLRAGTRHIPSYVLEDRSTLLDFATGHYDAVAIGKHTILKASAFSDDSSVWAFDIARQRFSHKPVVLTYRDARPSSGPMRLQLFGSGGRAFAYDQTTNEISLIGDDFKLDPVVKLQPPPKKRETEPKTEAEPVNGCPPTPCGPTPDLQPRWRVVGASHDTRGRLWMHVFDAWHVVEGNRVVRVNWLDGDTRKPLRDRPAFNQMVPGLAGDMVVLTSQGIATLRLVAK